MKKKILECCMVSVLLISSTVCAQQIHNMRGMVADANGKPLSGVVVQVPGTEKQALTDANGYFDCRLQRERNLVSLILNSTLRRRITRKGAFHRSDGYACNVWSGR